MTFYSKLTKELKRQFKTADIPIPKTRAKCVAVAQCIWEGLHGPDERKGFDSYKSSENYKDSEHRKSSKEKTIRTQEKRMILGQNIPQQAQEETERTATT